MGKSPMKNAKFKPGASGNPNGRPPMTPEHRHRALVRAFRRDLGDAELTNAEIELIDMAATATLEAQMLKGKVIAGAEVDGNETVRLLNSAARLLNMLGIQRKRRKPVVQDWAKLQEEAERLNEAGE
jgi:hypothetical protein